MFLRRLQFAWLPASHYVQLITIATVTCSAPPTSWPKAPNSSNVVFRHSVWCGEQKCFKLALEQCCRLTQFQLSWQLIPQTRCRDRKSTLSDCQSWPPDSEIAVSWCTECRSGRDFCNRRQEIYSILRYVLGLWLERIWNMQILSGAHIRKAT